MYIYFSKLYNFDDVEKISYEESPFYSYKVKSAVCNNLIA